VTTALPTKEFAVWQSEKSYRFKEEAFVNHAPQTPGIYELVTFDGAQNATVLYAGLVTDRSIFDALNEHFRGEREPTSQKLLAEYPNLYFSFIVESDAKTPEDLNDLFYAVVQQDKPTLLNPATVQPTGRYAGVTFKDRSIL
jgi:hypothetical protein